MNHLWMSCLSMTLLPARKVKDLVHFFLRKSPKVVLRTSKDLRNRCKWHNKMTKKLTMLMTCRLFLKVAISSFGMKDWPTSRELLMREDVPRLSRCPDKILPIKNFSLNLEMKASSKTSNKTNEKTSLKDKILLNSLFFIFNFFNTLLSSHSICFPS